MARTPALVGPPACRLFAVAALPLLLAALAAPAHAQQIRGRVLDSSHGGPVHLAAVWLLDREREQMDVAMADSVGRYFLTVPDSGEYFIAAERFGYFDTESPLFSIAGTRDYDLDLELRPEPIRVEGVDVTVRNERVIDWLTLEFGSNPVQAFGFRLLQGERLEEAKMKARLNPTATLRWLYIPITHGACVTINPFPRAERIKGSSSLTAAPGTVPTGTTDGSRTSMAPSSMGSGCGTLYLNDREILGDHIDSIDMTSIAIVATLPGSVRMYTYDFNWAFR